MKKIILFIALIASAFAATVHASEDDVIKLLSEHFPEHPDDFYVKEYRSKDDSYCTLLITLTETEDYRIGQNDIKDVATSIYTSKWADYNEITFIEYFVYEKTAYSRITVFSENLGSMMLQSGFIYRPWIIKEKDDMSENEVKLCWGVVKELLMYNKIWPSMSFEEKDFESMKIQNWADFAVASGTVHSDGKKYQYVMEFTFKADDDNSASGTYEAKYVEVNDIALNGEYIDIASYKKYTFD